MPSARKSSASVKKEASDKRLRQKEEESIHVEEEDLKLSPEGGSVIDEHPRDVFVSKKVTGKKTKQGKAAPAASPKKGSSKVIILDDGSDSEDSVVSVARDASPKISSRRSIGRFGSVDLHEDVVLHVADARPRVDRTTQKVRRVAVSSSPAESIVLASDSDAERALVREKAVDSVPLGEDSLSSPKKRRAVGDDNMSPSKICVQDLTLSPRKTVNGTNRDSRSPARRASGRNKKLSARAKEAVDSENSLIAKVDAALSRIEDVVEEAGHQSDTSYRPSSNPSKVKKSSKKIIRKVESALVEATTSTSSPGREGYTSGVTMRSNSPVGLATPRRPGMEAQHSIVKVIGGTSSESLETSRGGKFPAVEVRSPRKHKETGSSYRLIPDGSFLLDRVLNDAGAVVSSDLLRSSANPKSAAAAFPAAVPVPDSETEDEDEDKEGASESDEHERTQEPLLNVERIHFDLRALYGGLDWINGLRRSKFIGYPNNEGVFDDFTAMSYGGLLEKVSSRVKSKLIRAVVFMEYRDFKSLVRVSLANFTRNWECIRLPAGQPNRNACFVVSGVCHRSYVSQGREVGDSYVKQIHLRLLENDWEILQCNLGTFYNDDCMHAPGRYNALAFQTKRQGWNPRRNEKDSDKLASAPYSASKKSSVSGQSSADHTNGGNDSGDTGDIAKINVLERGAPAYRMFDEGSE
ncbi:hypothetical protein VNI00_008947 [Paramarasmius palmivorus]|uniref:Uncharacterized protein n=1 Tax=Paramarasmius palmivorus TaxID=297713 RepID=A0AAW0CT12_9AGAR